MKCHVGIDLGSTTTKAVVLDEEGAVLGRGITNSRSNYDVACEVARNEALLDARFNLFEARLERNRELVIKKDELLDALRRNFRLEQHMHQLQELERSCRTHAERVADRPDGPSTGLLDEVFDELFAGLREQAVALFAPGARRRSDFFRDVAGSGYMALAEQIARRHEIEYELLLGVYDKAIIHVEAQVPSTWLHEMLERGLRRTLTGWSLAEDLKATLEADVQRVIDVPLEEVATVGTGYGRARLPFPREMIRSEILCHGLGAHATFPRTRTVLDIGGQDTKAIQVDERGIVTSFQMNDRCAAGCGRYLGYIADEMNVGLHELGPMAMKSCRPVRINSTCTVFAGAELRDRLATGQKREDILAGLHRAIMLRAMSLLARSGGVSEEFTFTGGVANNEAAVSALRGLVHENWGERTINISPESIYTGALGAAIFARRSVRGGPRDAVAVAASGVGNGGAA